MYFTLAVINFKNCNQSISNINTTYELKMDLNFQVR